MRRWLLYACLCALAISTAACTLSPEPGSSATLPAQVLPADARALVYGRTVSEVIQSPELRDKIPALFGTDWMPGRGQIASGASAFFEKAGPLRMVNIAGKDYVAVAGCVASACPTRRVLMLIAAAIIWLVAMFAYRHLLRAVPRAGGEYRYIHRNAEAEWAFHGVFHSLDIDNMVQTFEFEGYPGHVSLDQVVIEDIGGGRSRIRGHSVFQSVADRDGMIESGMEHGVNASFERLDDVLARRKAS
jgi:uncharacterized protein YndB with AHSA1/START domain